MSAKRAQTFVLLAMAVFVAGVMALALYKWTHFAYNGLDLAIFSQALWNTVHGNVLGLSIHPYPTLGDHTEWVLLALAPVFALLPHPLTLVAIQAVALASSAYIVWRMARRTLPESWAAACGAGVLLLPAIGNAALFEFHPLVFALPILLLALDAFRTNRFGRFALFAGLALLVREDVALTVAAFGVVALIERRSWKWVLSPLLVSIFWFAGMLAIIGHFSPLHTSPFLAAYSWLWPPNVTTFFAHFLSVPQIELVLGLLMPVFLLPVLRPKWLILCTPAWILLAASDAGGGAAVFQMHYAVVLLPGMIAATLDALASLHANPNIIPEPFRKTHIVPLVLTIALFFSAAVFGPFARGTLLAFKSDAATAVTYKKAVALIPPQASVAASFRTIPHLANREKLISLHYLFLGTTYGGAPYAVEAPDFLILDDADFLHFQASFPSLAWASSHYQNGFGRIRNVLDQGAYGPIYRDGPITVWQRGAPRPQYTISPEIQGEIAPDITLATVREQALCPGKEAPCLALVLSSTSERNDDLALRVTDRTSNMRKSTIVPLRLTPTFSWPNNQQIVIPLPNIENVAGQTTTAELVETHGVLTLDALGTAVVRYNTITPVGVPVPVSAPDASAAENP